MDKHQMLNVLAWGKEASEGTLMKSRYKEIWLVTSNKIANVPFSQKIEIFVYMY